MFKRLPFFLIVIALLALGGYYGWRRLQDTVKVEPPQLVSVRRDHFVHEILERGNVESARNDEIRCQVESAGGLTIISVVPEGTLVKEGDLLVELDSSTLRENVSKQRITVLASEATLVQSTANLKTAELALIEYLEGTFEHERKTIENEIFAAQEQVSTQEDNLSYYKRLWERGYVTQSKVDADLIELEKANKAKEIAELKLQVLEKYTKEKNVVQYNATIASNKAKVKSDEETLKLDTDRLEHLEKQLASCRIVAPREGQVVYYAPPRWGGEDDIIKEGKKVFERQILLQLPDPVRMQVKGLINEATIRLVRPGQKATVRLEAFPNRVFDGVVKSVNDYPEPSSFFGGSMSKEYMATVKILNVPEGIKTGLTAEARIVVNEIPGTLLLPMQAVFEYGGKMYAVTYHEGKWDKIEVSTGPANDKEVVILEGLNEGDQVVLGAWAHRDKIDLPKLANEPRQNGGGEPERGERPSETPAGNTTGERSPTSESGNRPPRSEGRGSGGSGSPSQGQRP